MMYVQCTLVNEQQGQIVSWIPEEKGVGKGAKVTLVGEDGLWTVSEVWGRANHDQVMLQRDLYRHHREATDA